jgi:tRNA A-37 threonylcarbamoyl transferase component Bud32
MASVRPSGASAPVPATPVPTTIPAPTEPARALGGPTNGFNGDAAATAISGRLERLTGSIVAGKYYVLELLGEGGMGQVYKARHLTLDKLVCIKILRAQLNDNPTVVGRFEREAKSASRLKHPNSIQILDFGNLEKNGGFYICMEYVEGRDLATLLNDEWPLAEPRVCHIIAQVLSALSAAHAAQVIHRDLKPENIMLERIGDDPDFVKVLDFGIAKIVAPEVPGLTKGDLVCGTPQYMSPEQATGAPLDARSDLYTVGVILYRMVTGFLPFEGRNPMDFLTKHATEKPLAPRVRRPDAVISAELEHLILRALEKDPSKRPQTAEEFRRELLSIGGYGRAPTPETAKVVSRSTAPTMEAQPVAPAPTQQARLASTGMPARSAPAIRGALGEQDYSFEIMEMRHRARRAQLVRLGGWGGLVGIAAAAYVFLLPMAPPEWKAMHHSVKARILYEFEDVDSHGRPTKRTASADLDSEVVKPRPARANVKKAKSTPDSNEAAPSESDGAPEDAPSADIDGFQE